MKITTDDPNTSHPKNIILCQICDNNKNPKNYAALIDTGAHRSVISSKALRNIQYAIGESQTRQYVAANNQAIDLEPYYVNFTVLINKKPFKVRNAMVMRNYPKRQIIIGAPELNAHHATLIEANGKMTIGKYDQTTIQRFSMAQIGTRDSVNKIYAKIAMITPVEQHEHDHKVDNDTFATIGDTCYMGRAIHDYSNETIYEPDETCQGCL